MTGSDYDRYRESEREARRAYYAAREEARRAKAEARRARDAARRAARKNGMDDLNIDVTLDLDLSDLERYIKKVSNSGNYTYRYQRRRRRRRGWVLGVCRDIADYLGIEVWIVRVLMITGLIFMPTFVLPAYIVGGLGMRIWLSHRQRRAERLAAEEAATPGAASAGKAQANGNEARDEPVADLLQRAAARMARAERRLREMEAYVTSGRYDLQRELHELDRSGSRG
jgi:phage shock protein C